MKKTLITVCLLLSSFVTSVFALEWGGLVNNVTSVTAPNFKDLSLFQSNGAYLWVKSALNKEKSMSIAAEAMYKYNLTSNEAETNLINIIDLDLLKFSGNWDLTSGYLNVNAGRYIFSDNTGSYFAQNSDGINVVYDTPDWKVGGYVGYTGLQNRFVVVMNDAIEEKSEQFYDLTYGYVPIMVNYTYKGLGRNSISGQLSYFVDTTVNKLDKAYGSLLVQGMLGKIGTYSFNAVLGTEKFKNVMARSSLDLSFYFGQNIIASFGADYASGQNKMFSIFQPITYTAIHNSPSVSGSADVVVPRFTAVFAYDKLAVTLNEKLVMSFPEKFELNGLDSSLNVIYNLFSDLQIGASLNVYADFINTKSNNYSAVVNASFAF